MEEDHQAYRRGPGDGQQADGRAPGNWVQERAALGNRGLESAGAATGYGELEPAGAAVGHGEQRPAGTAAGQGEPTGLWGRQRHNICFVSLCCQIHNTCCAMKGITRLKYNLASYCSKFLLTRGTFMKSDFLLIELIIHQ